MIKLKTNRVLLYKVYDAICRMKRGVGVMQIFHYHTGIVPLSCVEIKFLKAYATFFEFN